MYISYYNNLLFICLYDYFENQEKIDLRTFVPRSIDVSLQRRIGHQLHAVQLADIGQAVADGVSVRHSSPVD